MSIHTHMAQVIFITLKGIILLLEPLQIRYAYKNCYDIITYVRIGYVCAPKADDHDLVI